MILIVHDMQGCSDIPEIRLCELANVGRLLVVL